MQAEVDVAIVMKVMNLAFHQKLDCLVLLAGDGDFRDMVSFVTETLYKRAFIVGYKGSISPSLIEKATPGCIIYLDDIWPDISTQNGPILNQSQQYASNIENKDDESVV